MDDLHERAGSTRVLHLHGMLKRARSVRGEKHVYDIGAQPISIGDLAEDGAQLRPDIVWFGEDVERFPLARRLARHADLLIVVGTSLLVNPAAGLVSCVGDACRSYFIDPNAQLSGVTSIAETATRGVPLLVDALLSE